MNYSILSEAITLSGHRIIQESALCANRHMNRVIKGKINFNLENPIKRSEGERMTVVGTDYSVGFSQSLN
jgi:hypothetical protein